MPRPRFGAFAPDYTDDDGRAPGRFWFSEHFNINPTKRFLSAEIEVSSAVDAAQAEEIERLNKKWGGFIHCDCAFEWCTAPANGDVWIDQIEEIGTMLTRFGVRTGTDAGCHLHIDTRDFTELDLRKLVRLYSHLEPTIFSMVPAARRSNDFCRPCAPRFRQRLQAPNSSSKDTKDLQDWVAHTIYGLNAKETEASGRKQAKTGTWRLSALNFLSHYYRGTVECRLLEGTVVAERIQHWGIMWAAIVEFAKQTPEECLKDIKRGSVGLLMRISPTLANRRWIAKTIREHRPMQSPRPRALRLRYGRPPGNWDFEHYPCYRCTNVQPYTAMFGNYCRECFSEGTVYITNRRARRKEHN